MIELAVSTPTKGVQYIEADAYQLPLEGEMFDMVVSNFTIHHFKSVAEPFTEVARVLKPKGYFVATFNIFEAEDQELYNTEIPLCLSETVTVKNLIKTHEEMKNGLIAAGFAITQYDEMDSSYLSIPETYPHKEKIDRVVNIICVSQKIN
jgi:ubiquinone/menaquinone biosynthesis C-methylase UbiE